MPALFDAYVIVDWSAAATPTTGADSVWIGTLERRDDGGLEEARNNPPTRAEAIRSLTDRLAELVARDRRVLLGVDAAFGYPAGFAGRLRPDVPDWRGVWEEVSARIEDEPDNANNRFRVAAELNERLSGRAFPFWGCPAAAAGPRLSPTRPEGFDDGFDGGLAEYRLTDRRAPGTQSVWKLAYPGSVGSQTLLAIAHLQALRHDPRLRERMRIWPFETGLAPPDRSDTGRVVVGETWPSIVPHEQQGDEPRDAAQVRGLARHFAALDERGALAPLFGGPPDLTDAERTVIEREEAWILGIETVRPAARRYDYVRDPQEIYRRSFAVIRAETDLNALPAALHDVAVRLVHACGTPDLVAALAWGGDVAAAARDALAAGAPILVDARMVAAGVIQSRLPVDNAVLCTLEDTPTAAGGAGRTATTRSAAAVELWRPHLEGAIVAIGNAPTALFRLLELLDEGAPWPACILGFPVGFVGAAESKEALIAHPAGVPYLTVRGRRGGSALAAAAVNALAAAP